MNLYYVPGACSLADHIALLETGLPCQLVAINRSERTADGRDFKARLTADGRDFTTINPKGQVPTLELDDGTVLTENLAILVYIAHRTGKLLAADGLPRWRAIEATSFLTTEVHGSFRPFFYPDATPAEKDRARQKQVKHLATLAAQLGDGPFLLGEQMTIADPYLFVMLRWAAMFAIEVPATLGAYAARMAQVPSVARALAAEGLT